MKDGILEDFNEFLVCKFCLEGKMTKRPCNAKGNKANDLLELVHSNVYFPMSTQAKGGYVYLLMIDLDLVMCT